MKVYLLVLLLILTKFSVGQINPFSDLLENEQPENYCELEKWYEKFDSLRKIHEKAYNDRIEILTIKLKRLKSDSCVKNKTNDSIKGMLYYRLGAAYRETNLVEQSLQTYNKALQIFKSTFNDKYSAITYRKLGVLWMLKKDFNKAHNYFETAERICIENGYNVSLFSTYNEMINNIFNWNQDTILIHEIRLKADKIEGISKTKKINFETNLAYIYVEIGLYKKALEKYIIAETYYRETNNYQNLAIILKNQAEVNIELGKYNVAEVKLLEILALIENEKINIKSKHFYADYLLTKALLYDKQKLYKDAINEYQKILQFINPQFTYKTIYQNPSPNQIVGNPYLLTTLADKAEVFKKMYQQSGDKANLKHALNCYQLSYTAADEMRKNYSFEEANTYLSDYTYNYYEKAIALCQTLAQVYPEQNNQYQQKAFEIAQRSSMKTLFWEINSRYAENFLPQTIKLQLSTLRKEITELEGHLRKSSDSNNFSQKLFTKKQALEAKLLESDGLTAFNKFNQHLVQPEKLQAKLQANQALLNYFYGDSLIYCFLFTQNQFNIIEIENPVLITKNIIAFRNSISNYGNAKNLGYQLYQQLLKKALAHLPVRNPSTKSFFERFNPFSLNNNHQPSKANLIIIPDGILSALPFEALQQSSKDGDYLLNDYTISYDLHSSFFNQKRKSDVKEVINLLGSSVEDFSNYETKLDSLPYSKIEVDMAVKLFKGKNLNPATKSDFLKQFSNYNIVHLSTHASADTLDAANSRIYFSPYGNESDNILTRDEILNHQCPAEMIVLSACETGYGKQNRGEGIASLARAFRTIGSQSEVMTLWNVNDYSTSEIIQSFYQYLKNGQTKSEALRQAKLDYLANQHENNLRHPKYWAALVLQGNPRAVY